MELKGKKVFIKTVTGYYTGEVSGITKSYYQLKNAAWIPDSGRYHDALAKGTLQEVEPIPGWTLIARASIVEVSEWKHALPQQQR
jgi:hypothetical protein